MSDTIIRTRRSGEEELAKYMRTSNSLEELKKRPEELNPNKLETYLSEEDFQVSLIICVMYMYLIDDVHYTLSLQYTCTLEVCINN